MTDEPPWFVCPAALFGFFGVMCQLPVESFANCVATLTTEN
ncbi:MAG TPA: hypothetical protein VM600_05585 [Actinomycetota bacterium]|nr:hypothetical protein [Actinomycetota bacterium]